MPLPLGRVARRAPRSKIQREPGAPSCQISSRVGVRWRPRRRNRWRSSPPEVISRSASRRVARPNRVLADDVAELGPAAGEEVTPVGEQEVDISLSAQLRPQRRDLAPELAHLGAGSRRGRRRGAARASSRRRIRCGSPSGASSLSFRRLIFGQRPVVREDPVPPPEHALERVRVLQRRAPPRVFRRTCAIDSSVLNRVLTNEVGHRAGAGRCRLQEAAREPPLVERDTPAVRVRPRLPPAERKAREGKDDVRGGGCSPSPEAHTWTCILPDLLTHGDGLADW